MTDTLHVVGARPNFMKASPVVVACQKIGLGAALIHTGQHYDETLSDIFFKELRMPKPDENLGVGSGSHAEQTASLMVKLEKTLLRYKPRMVVVYGDINSTAAAALVAAKLEMPVAHVEAGLRSYDRTMPEEINRIVTDVLSTYWYVTAPEGLDNLAKEGIKGESVHHVGNPMIDTLLRFREQLDTAGAAKSLGLDGAYGVVTLHRPGNVDDPGRIKEIVAALSELSKELPLVFPIHPRGKAAFATAGINDAENIIITEPLGYLEFMALLSGSSIVVTDSGGIQEETSVLGVPCLTVRPNTERPITVTAGTNRLVEPGKLVAEATKCLQKDWSSVDIPLWDGRAGERIAEQIAEDLNWHNKT